MVDANKHQEHAAAGKPIVSLRRRQTLATILLGGAILISGIGIGFGSALAYIGRSKTTAVAEDTLPTSAAVALTQRFAEEYDLDEQQTGKVKSLMLKRLEALKEIRTKAMDEMLVVHRAINEDMKGVMKPDQFKDWNEGFHRARKRSKFRHRPWKRPGPPPHERRGGPEDRGSREDRRRPEGRGEREDRRGPEGRGERGEDRRGPEGRGGHDMFRRLDADNNGELTQNEIKQAHPKALQKLQQLMKKADTNRDGKIDKEEFDEHMRRRRPPPEHDRMRNPRSRPDRDTENESGPALSMLWAYMDI